MPRAAVVKLALVCLLLPILPTAGSAGVPAPAPPIPDILDLAPGGAVTDIIAKPVDVRRLLRTTARSPRIAVISSGIDVAVLPQSLRGQVTWPSADHAGYGTYVASVLLQVAPGARVTSLDVYPKDKVDVAGIGAAITWATQNAKDLDAVLYAVPPHELLDPMSALMVSRRWDRVADWISDSSINTKDGVILGVSESPAIRAAQTRGLSSAARKGIAEFVTLSHSWNSIAGRIAELGQKGVAFVAPAGDFGPGIQTILGLGNLPGVVTVGGANDGRVSDRSSSGPSIDGRVKPDLVAPTGLVGLMPEASAMATALRDAVDASLQPVWDAGEPVTKARARLDSSFSGAAVVAAATAGMAAEGLRDVARQRGALTAASVPSSGVSPWRQGAGVLRMIPDKAFADSRPLALGHADLGVEPDTGRWAARVPFVQGDPAEARADLFAFAGVGPDAKTFTRDVSEAPPLDAIVAGSVVDVVAQPGDDRFEGGVFCGYNDVSIPGTSGSVDVVPDGVEQIPVCLVKGSRLQAHGFYIHDMPAEDLTFALLPALPPEASILDKPLHILPVNPMSTRIYQRVTGPDGNAWFPNVVPGYYTIRLFSDYGAPMTQTLLSSATGGLLDRVFDVGHNPSYLSFPALVLSATHWTEQDLKDRFGEQNVKKEAPTGAYMVRIGPRVTRVVLGFVKDKPGAGVSSRYIDLLTYDDLSFGALPLAELLDLPKALSAVGGDIGGWSFRRGAADAQDLVAQLNPVAALGNEKEILGVASYPFSLTTPNYTGHMSLNFSYEVENASIVAVVIVGEEAMAGVVTPAGTLQTPAVGTSHPIGTGGLALTRSTGLANFEFPLPLGNVDKGRLVFIFVPSRPVQQAAAPLVAAKIGDLSFALSTWQRVEWPGQMTPHGMGHLFSIDPNYSAQQMSAPECRAIDSGGVNADVCEDWRVMIHSPGDDAATVELVDATGSVNGALRSFGSTYADPQRGTADFGMRLLAPAVRTIEDLTRLVPMDFKTNGRFWEQLVMTKDVVKQHPGPIEVQIVDNIAGRSSDLLPHVTGGAPVAPYVPFEAEALVVDGETFTIADRDADGVPQLRLLVAPSPAVPVEQVLSFGDPDDQDPAVPGSSLSLSAPTATVVDAPVATVSSIAQIVTTPAPSKVLAPVKRLVPLRAPLSPARRRR